MTTNTYHEVLQLAAQWLHAAYDRPPQTPEAAAMLRMVDAALASTPAQPVAMTDTFVQPVPDKCDRITWRGQYLHLDTLSAQAAPQPVAMTDERAAFEAEMRDTETWGHCNLSRTDKGSYRNDWVETMWDVWQARAALAAQAAPKVPEAKAQELEHKTAHYYEDLREIIDGGSESMTHQDALEELKAAMSLYREVKAQAVPTPFEHWLNSQRDQRVSEVFHEIVERAAAPQPSPSEQRKPLTEGFTADVECITDESGTEYSVSVRGPGIRNPLYSDVWLKKKPATLLAKWLNGEVFPAIGIRPTGGEHG